MDDLTFDEFIEDYYKGGAATQSDMVQVANPTAEDFSWPMEKANYTIKAGDAQPFLRYVAIHICKHLTDRELMRNKKHHDQLHNPEARNEWRKKIIVGVVEHNAPPEKLTRGQIIERENALRQQQLDAKLKQADELISRLEAQEKKPEDTPKEEKSKK